jgi:hypothetical protein
MSDARKIGNLELNKETIQELTEEEGEQAQGGMAGTLSRNCSVNPNACRLAEGAAYGAQTSANPNAC